MRIEKTGCTGKNKRKRSSKLSRALRSFDWGTLVALILFFPLGITRMWKARNRWPSALKYAITGAFVAAASLVFVTTALTIRTPKGGVELCESEEQVMIYGPEAPKAMVEGYTAVRGNSAVLDGEVEEESVTYVYAAQDAKCYHTWKCKFAYASSSRITVYEAYCLGYAPCKACNPPIYDPTSFAAAPAAVDEAAESDPA